MGIPSTHGTTVPIVNKTEWEIIDIGEEGDLTLWTKVATKRRTSTCPPSPKVWMTKSATPGMEEKTPSWSRCNPLSILNRLLPTRRRDKLLIGSCAGVTRGISRVEGGRK